MRPGHERDHPRQGAAGRGQSEARGRGPPVRARVEEHLRFTARLYGVADVDRRLPALLAELQKLLRAHELVKLRFVGIERDERTVLCAQIADDWRQEQCPQHAMDALHGDQYQPCHQRSAHHPTPPAILWCKLRVSVEVGLLK